MNKAYEAPQFEVMKFQVEDVVTTSSTDGGGNLFPNETEEM